MIRLHALLLSALSVSSWAASMPAAALPPPRAIAIDTSASQSVDFGLPATPLIVPIRQLRVRFDQPLAAMANAPVANPRGNVGDGAEFFRLVSAGRDGAAHTTSCNDVPAGDDVDVGVRSLQWSTAAPEVTLTLDGDVALPAGSYRLLACDGLLGVSGLALDGDGDGLPGGVARFDFLAEESPQLANPTFDADVAHWRVNHGMEAAAHDPRDADGAEYSGSLRITSDGTQRSLTSDTCIELGTPLPIESIPPLSFRARYRVRVVTGTVRIITTAWFGFRGDMGETGCVGPGISTIMDARLREAGSSFDSFDSGPLLAIMRGPLADLSLHVASVDGEPFEVLLDDIGFGFNHTAVFRGGFE